MNGWLIFFVLLAAYFGVLMLLRTRGGQWKGFEINGPFIMWRTQAGRTLIDRVSRPRRMWNAIADVGIYATFIVGALILLLFVLNFVLTIYLSYTRPEAIADSAQSPEFFLGLPGVNPLIPLGWGITALVIALVIHEGSHFVMAIVSRIRVKSSGLLFFIVPIGAFVEPDEVDMEKATARERNRVFAAGPTSNLIVAIICGFLLCIVVGQGLAVATNGVLVVQVDEGTPARAAGLENGEILYAIGRWDANSSDVSWTMLRNSAQFSATMANTTASETIAIATLSDGVPRSRLVTLADRADVLRAANPNANTTAHEGKGYLGVRSVGMELAQERRDAFANPVGSLRNLFVFTQYPIFVFFEGLDVFSEPYNDAFVLTGMFEGWSKAAYFGTVAFLFWVVWINLTLGTFNALPAGPLDGGQMFKTSLRERLLRNRKVDPERIDIVKQEFGGVKLVGKDEETQKKLDDVARIQKRATWTLGFSILALLLLPILGPHVLRLFF